MTIQQHSAARFIGKGLPGLVALAAGVLLAASRPAKGQVTIFQQGLRPNADYAGCTDTTIRGRGWALERPKPKDQSLTTYADKNPMIRFDLSSLGADRKVHQAILRLYYTALPSSPTQPVEAYTLKREWDDTATWFEYKYFDGKKTDKNNWDKFGGDMDQTDWGKGKPGLVARANTRGGPFGHIVELDVTALAAEWVAGKRPNYGFKIVVPRGAFTIASSEWPMPAFRPALVVEHYAPGQSPAPDAKLALPAEPTANASLSPLTRTRGLKPPGVPPLRKTHDDVGKGRRMSSTLRLLEEWGLAL